VETLNCKEWIRRSKTYNNRYITNNNPKLRKIMEEEVWWISHKDILRPISIKCNNKYLLQVQKSLEHSVLINNNAWVLVLLLLLLLSITVQGLFRFFMMMDKIIFFRLLINNSKFINQLQLLPIIRQYMHQAKVESLRILVIIPHQTVGKLIATWCKTQ
jgi:hypothetical protein